MATPGGIDFLWLHAYSGCLPFTWKFRWFHTESKWNKHISTAQPELFRNERFVWKGCPLLPIGTFQSVNVVPFTSFLFFHQFQALLDLTIEIIKRKAHNPNGIFYPKFCLPLAQFQTGWVFHVNGKQPVCPKKKATLWSQALVPHVRNWML
jgi:hypothetical protein